MSQVSINLDDVVGDDIEFVLNGEKFYLPPDIPAESMVRLMWTWEKAQGADEDEGQAMRRVYDVILEFFQIRQPDLRSSFELAELVESGEITPEDRADYPELRIGLQQIGVVMAAVEGAYNTTVGGDEEDEAPVPLDRPKQSVSGNGSSRSNGRSAGARKTGGKSAGAKSRQGAGR